MAKLLDRLLRNTEEKWFAHADYTIQKVVRRESTEDVSNLSVACFDERMIVLRLPDIYLLLRILPSLQYVRAVTSMKNTVCLQCSDWRALRIPSFQVTRGLCACTYQPFKKFLCLVQRLVSNKYFIFLQHPSAVFM